MTQGTMPPSRMSNSEQLDFQEFRVANPTIRYGISVGDTHSDCTRGSDGIREINGEC